MTAVATTRQRTSTLDASLHGHAIQVTESLSQWLVAHVLNAHEPMNEAHGIAPMTAIAAAAMQEKSPVNALDVCQVLECVQIRLADVFLNTLQTHKVRSKPKVGRLNR